MFNINKYLRKEYKNGAELQVNDENIKIITNIVSIVQGRETVKDIDVFEQEARSVKYLIIPSEYEKINDFIEKNKIESEINFKEKKLLLIKTILFNDFRNYEELSSRIGLSVKEIRKILQSKTLVSEYSKSAFVKIGEKISVLDDFERKKEADERYSKKRLYKLKSYDEYVWLYLNSREKISVVRTSKTMPALFRRDIESGELSDNYPKDILKKIEEKSDFLNRHKDKKNSQLIRNYKMIDIVKDDVLYANTYIINKLKLVLTYFSYFGNIERMLENEEDLASYNSVLSSLMLPELEDYLKKDAYLKLNKYLEVEKMYQSTIYGKRVDLVRNNFLEYSGNLYFGLENCDNKELVLYLLGDKIVREQFGEDIYNRVIEILNAYDDKKYVIDELYDAKQLSLK